MRRLADTLAWARLGYDDAIALERRQVRAHRIGAQRQSPGQVVDRRRAAPKFGEDSPARAGQKSLQPVIGRHNSVQIVTDGRR